MAVCRYCGGEFTQGAALLQHERACRSNPRRPAPYDGTGHPLTAGFKAVHLIASKMAIVDQYKEVWRYFGCKSHRETLELMLETILMDIHAEAGQRARDP